MPTGLRASFVRWLDAVGVDAKQTLRGFLRTPAFLITVTVTLGLGIGANATMLGIVEHLLLRGPAHTRAPESLRLLLFSSGADRDPIAATSYPVYSELERTVDGFEQTVAFAAREVAFRADDEMMKVRAHLVSANYFATLGVHATVGRVFLPADTTAGQALPVAVLGASFWKREFSGAPAVLGTSIQLGDRLFTVVGVAPDGFTGIDLEPVDVFVPFSHSGELTGVSDWRHNSGSVWLKVFGRIGEDASPALVEAQATTALRRANAASGLPAEILANTVHLSAITAARAAERQLEVRMSVALAIISLMVLLSACANVGYMMLARAIRNERLTAIRSALGASRARLVTQLTLESVVIALLGGVAAMAVVHWASVLLRSVLLPDIEWYMPPLNMKTVLTVLLLVAVIAGVTAFSRSRRFSKVNARLALGTAGVAGQARLRVHRTLLITQASLAMIVVAAASLFVRSLQAVRAIDTGVDLPKVLVVTLDADDSLAARSRRVYEELAEELRQVPQVQQVAAVSRSVPLLFANGIAVKVPDRATPPRVAGTGPYYSGISPAFFEVLGTERLAGRLLTRDDLVSDGRVAVINATMARRWWGRENPIGACLILGSDSACTRVVGVVGDIIKFRLIGEPEPQMLYVPPTHRLVRLRAPDALLVRSSGMAVELGPSVKRLLRLRAPEFPRASVTALSEVVEPQVRPWKLSASVLSWFAALALIICSVGLYGLMSYLVVQRGQEIGIRRALGATSGDVARLVLREGVGVVGVGIAAGTVVALMSGRLIAGLLYGVSPVDLRVMTFAGLVLLIASVLAGVVPSWRAVRVDPMVVMRNE